MPEKKNYPEFRELLRNGIGTRTQKEFAEETGIAKETINRWLNSQTISQPGRESLQKIAKHIRTHTLNEFYTACGYPVVTLEENVQNMENELNSGLDQVSNQPFESISDLLGTVETLWLPEGSFRKTKQKVEVEKSSSDSDYTVDSSLVWEFDDKVCELMLRLYYAETRRGKIFLLKHELLQPSSEDLEDGFLFRNRKLVSFTVVSEPVKRGRAVISGRKPTDSGDPLFACATYTTTILGFGFVLKDRIPKGFRDYLFAHASAFCTTKELGTVYRDITEAEDLEQYFDSLRDADGYIRSDALLPGAIIAKILSVETGQQFFCFSSYPDEGSTVMMRCESCLEINKVQLSVVSVVYEAAKTLGVEEFGACYIEEHLPKVGSIFATKDFHIEY